MCCIGNGNNVDTELDVQNRKLSEMKREYKK